MKNSILLSILSILLLSSCGALETSTLADTDDFQNFSEADPYRDYPAEEDYWLMTNDICTPLFKDPFWSLRMTHRGIQEKYNYGYHRKYRFDKHPKYGIDYDH